MRKKSFELTKGEERIMEFFWDSQSPLTSMDISSMTDEFNDSYIHRLLTSLLKKEMLEVNGIEKSGKQYARKFVPTMTREEYGAMVIEGLGIRDEKALAKVAVALFKKTEGKDKKEETDPNELIKELENIVEQLKNS